jgi:hypothetical protein
MHITQSMKRTHLDRESDCDGWVGGGWVAGGGAFYAKLQAAIICSERAAASQAAAAGAR